MGSATRARVWRPPCRRSEWTSAAAASKARPSTSRPATSRPSGTASRRPQPSTPDAVAAVVAEVVTPLRVGRTDRLHVSRRRPARRRPDCSQRRQRLDRHRHLGRRRGGGGCPGARRERRRRGRRRRGPRSARPAAGTASSYSPRSGRGSAPRCSSTASSVPNTELGHLVLDGAEAEDLASDAARERDDLEWQAWAQRLQRYYAELERLLWPDLFVVGGGGEQEEREVPAVPRRPYADRASRSAKLGWHRRGRPCCRRATVPTSLRQCDRGTPRPPSGQVGGAAQPLELRAAALALQPPFDRAARGPGRPTRAGGRRERLGEGSRSGARRAARRFCSCERCSLAVTVSTPSTSRLASRSSALACRAGGSAVVRARSHDSSTRLSLVLTDWPPGPPPSVRNATPARPPGRRPSRR
jgi:polyphosphate glucokinase